jgi:hypothetical protein
MITKNAMASIFSNFEFSILLPPIVTGKSNINRKVKFSLPCLTAKFFSKFCPP